MSFKARGSGNYASPCTLVFVNQMKQLTPLYLLPRFVILDD